MHCTNCGAELKDGAKFCTKCGRPTEPLPTQRPQAVREKGKKKRKHWIPILIVVLCLALLGGAAGVYFSSSARDVASDFQKGRYDMAIQTYNYQVMGNALEEHLAYLLLSKQMDEIETDYIAEKRSAEDVIWYYTEICELQDSRLGDLAAIHMTSVTMREFARNGMSAYNDGDYLTALDYFNNVSKDAAIYPEIKEQMEECRTKYQQQTVEQIRQLVDEGDTQGALDALQEALYRLPDDPELLEWRSQLLAAHESETAQLAQRLADEGKYEAALGVLQDALEEQPESETLKNLYANLEKTKPILLSDVPLIDSDGYTYTSGTYTDSYGNNYEGCHCIWAGWKSGYAYFNLDRQYTTFSGSIVADPRTLSEAKLEIKIYADDTLIYQKDGFTKLSAQEDFQLDVSGIQKLEIRVSLDWYSGYIGVVNANLLK